VCEAASGAGSIWVGGGGGAPADGAVLSGVGIEPELRYWRMG
jgi:hypothetical protein